MEESQALVEHSDRLVPVQLQGQLEVLVGCRVVLGRSGEREQRPLHIARFPLATGSSSARFRFDRERLMIINAVR